MFEWNEDKARTNLKKHGVSFQEALEIFDDELSVTFSDPMHSDDEDRFIIIGLSFGGRLLMVSHAHREEKIRIISAREPTKKERRDYENDRKKRRRR